MCAREEVEVVLGEKHHMEQGWHWGEVGGISSSPSMTQGKLEGSQALLVQTTAVCVWWWVGRALHVSPSSSCSQASSFHCLLPWCCCLPPPSWANSSLSVICCYPLANPRRCLLSLPLILALGLAENSLAPEQVQTKTQGSEMPTL